MSAQWAPPRRTYHLRVLATSLALIVFCLAGFLFGVQMEAVVQATGTITARDLHELRTIIPGLVEPGWYEGQVAGSGASVRLDSRGSGLADTGTGKLLPVEHQQVIDGKGRLSIERMRFHRLQPGDELWPGQALATIRPNDLLSHHNRLDDRIREVQGRGEATAGVPRQVERAQDQFSHAVLRVPDTAERWLVLDVRTAPDQAVQAGDIVAMIVPVDPNTHQPQGLIARLEVDEKYFGQLQKDQTVRIYSTMYNHRLHGHAEAQINKLEPMGEQIAKGERHFHALAPVTGAPFALPIGSTFKAEVVVGRKLVYRIILEH